MPEPLVIPATRTERSRICTSSEATFMRVSVVIIARATDSNPSGDRPDSSFGTAPVSSFGSNSTPMTPVDAGITYSVLIFKAFATALHESSAARSPLRVAQFALPAFTRIAATLPLEDCKCLRASRTGAACTTFCVNTAAA